MEGNQTQLEGNSQTNGSRDGYQKIKIMNIEMQMATSEPLRGPSTS